MACWAVVMRARVGSPRFVPKLETRTSSAMPVTLRDVVAQVLRSCVRFVASLLLRCRGRFSRLLRALPHEAGIFWLHLVPKTLKLPGKRPVLWLSLSGIRPRRHLLRRGSK